MPSLAGSRGPDAAVFLRPVPLVALVSMIAPVALASFCAFGSVFTACARQTATDRPRGMPAVRDTNVQQNNTQLLIGFGGKTYASFDAPRLAGRLPRVMDVQVAGGWRRVRMSWDLDRDVAQNDLAITFDLHLVPDFQWIPHLTPVDGFCVAQNVFRAPAIVVAEGGQTLVLVPDLELCGQSGADSPWYLDYDAPRRRAAIGVSKVAIPAHVLYQKVPGARFARGTFELGFFAKAYIDTDPLNPWREVSRFLWDRYAAPLLHDRAAGSAADRAADRRRVPLDDYVEAAYRWAFDGPWRDLVWHEFDLGRGPVGGAVDLVDVTQSPNYSGAWLPRGDPSIWNQAWFSSLRTGSGMLRFGRRHADTALQGRAERMKALALSAPLRKGMFPSVLRVAPSAAPIDGRRRGPAAWHDAFWTNSDRCPVERGVTQDWYHVLDATWTALQMLRWHEELERDPELLRFARRYADTLIGLQQPDGFFPDWLHPATRQPANVLIGSPETSLGVTFLLELSDATADSRYRDAALRAMDAVLAGPVPVGRWEDFETYWSDNDIGRLTHVGRRFARNGMFKQNTLSMYYTAEALLASFGATADPRYLAWGQRTLDELSMAQQVWEPPFIHVPALGGFGVMNADGEWNDARQSLFAELYMDYYVATGDARYFERGVAALRCGFATMYTPLNPIAKAQWERRHPFLGPADYGFAMENYAHPGAAGSNGLGIGGFAIFDWGAGSASEAYNRVVDHYGHVYIDRVRGQGFGIDQIAVDLVNGRFELTDLCDRPRPIRVVFEDGSEKWLRLAGFARL